MSLEDFDLGGFWDQDSWANDVGGKLTDELVAHAEQVLGYRLPEAYIELMRIQNGGNPVNTCFPTESEIGGSNFAEIGPFFSLDREGPSSLHAQWSNEFWMEEWGYPNIGIYIAATPSGGHELIGLDYRECGPQGEPSVLHIDQEEDYKETFLAPDFESFIRGLVHESQVQF